ncbi:adenylate/guanylate cyclase domain-containing protein [Rathayibacter sp. AY1F3]|uniref:adenylate/guanylate cyclase domain-containing protein n=1 Tax=Rathayibacter sp. AY1F3 TaxID=2080558 RepID=UPI000CE83A58|nr:adenylate/guanylate cyclase domain-containing protein [Rathayibacter sp. AY1F3]PPG92839.1 adenylate/guanylate cyclase domain-containing protein [Rathayibacter sp. AY1F3]
MSTFTPQQFGQTVMRDFAARRDGSVLLSKAQERSLAHPRFEDLPVGGRTTAAMTVAFLDLTDFTGRSFWDDPAEVADLAHAVLSGFIETVIAFGGFPLGLRGDGLFAGFGPGTSEVDAAMALAACAFALNAVNTEVNPLLKQRGIRPVQARAGLDHGTITFIRSGSDEHSEVNPLGFAANFAAKCEKQAKSWEIVIGENLAGLLPDEDNYTEHAESPKKYQRDYEPRYYHFYDYRWRRSLPHLQSALDQLHGRPTASIAIS